MSDPRTPEAQRLLTLAADHMLAHGVSGVSLSALAKRIGSNNRMLLYYFGSKDALFSAALAEAHTRFPALRELPRVLAADGDVGAVLISAWRAVRAEQNLPYIRLFFETFGIAARTPEQNRTQMSALSAEWPGALTALFLRHGRSGEEADRAALQVLGLWRGLQFSLLEGVAVADLDRAHDTAIETLFS